MENLSSTCDHRWRYFVDVQSRSVRHRVCERCGLKSGLALVAPAAQPVLVERLSA